MCSLFRELLFQSRSYYGEKDSNVKVQTSSDGRRTTYGDGALQIAE